MAKEYLYTFYGENQLARNNFNYRGADISLENSGCPKYVVACQGDHITPPMGVLDSAEMLAGDVNIVLASGGHVRGVINPPDSNRGSYQVAGDPDMVEGSWWNHWLLWLIELSGEAVEGNICAPAQYPDLEPAPGSYVRAK